MTLKELRTALGLSQRELGARIGVRHTRVATWEGGVERVPDAHRETIAAVLDRTDIDWDIPRLPRSSPTQHVRFRVRGSTGEKDDRVEWFVGEPHMTMEPALLLARRLNQWCEQRSFDAGALCLPSWAVRDSATCPDDPLFVCDYTGTHYEVVPVMALSGRRGGARHRGQ